MSALDPHAGAADNFALWQSSPFFPLALGDEQQVNNAHAWLAQWLAMANSTQASTADWRATLDQTNPAFVLRNHLLQHAIEQAQKGEFSEVNRLFAALSDPYDSTQLPSEYIAQPPEWAQSLVLSCSS